MRIFKEEQRFTQLWLIVLIGVSMIVPLGIIITTYIKEPDSFSTLEFIAILGIMAVASGIIFIFKLSSRIDEQGFHYKFFPFHRTFRLIAWHEVQSAYLRNYDAISEYGGWGLKGGALWNRSNGTAIYVSGDIGIQLELKNGKKILIGTQKQHDAQAVLETYKDKLITSTDV